MTSTRVVVTGLGTTSPVGGDVATTWEALLAGRPASGTSTDDWADAAAGQDRRPRGRRAVRGPRAGQGAPARPLQRSSRWSPPTQAWADAGLEDSGLEPERLGVALASGIGGVTTLLANYDALLEKGPRRVSPLAVPMLMPNAPAANVSLKYGARAAVARPDVGLRVRQRGDRAWRST